MTQPPQQPFPPAGGQAPAGYYGPPPGYPAGPPPGYPAYGYPQQLPPPVALSPGGAPLADFGSRLLAFMIDSAIMTGVAMVVAVPAFFLIFARMTKTITDIDPDSTTAPDPGTVFGDIFGPILLLEAGLFLLLLVVYYFYYVEYVRRSGQSIGKKAMHIRIVPIDPSAALTRGIMVKRYGIEFVGGMFVPFFSYLDGLWQLWDKPYQQTLHDKVAQTVVIKVSS